MSIQICEPVYDYKKFLEWFGNVRDYVDVDLEKATDDLLLGKECDFPFSLDQMKAWQQVGLISVSPMYVGNDFKPYQRIFVHCKMIKCVS